MNGRWPESKAAQPSFLVFHYTAGADEAAGELRGSAYTLSAPKIREDVNTLLKKPDLALIKVNPNLVDTRLKTLFSSILPAAISSGPKELTEETVNALFAAGYGLSSYETTSLEYPLHYGNTHLARIEAETIKSVWSVAEELLEGLMPAEWEESDKVLFRNAAKAHAPGFASGDSGGPLFSIVNLESAQPSMKVHAVNYSVQTIVMDSGKNIRLYRTI